jgi:hypothetical protein
VALVSSPGNTSLSLRNRICPPPSLDRDNDNDNNDNKYFNDLNSSCTSHSRPPRRAMLPTFILSTLALAASTALAATTCNGHSELCNRSYGNVTFVGTHDSYAVGSSIADNQDQSVTQQLVRVRRRDAMSQRRCGERLQGRRADSSQNDGVRMLQVQA